MRSTRFDSDIAEELSRRMYAPASSAGNYPPRVFFKVDDDDRSTMRAHPDGVSIVCSLRRRRRASHVSIVEQPSGKHIAYVLVYAPSGEDLTTETIAIASALYWSWWRARDMNAVLDEVTP